MSPTLVPRLDYIFWSFRIIEFIFSYFENRILLKLVLRDVASVASVITGHEQTQLNRVRYFLFFSLVYSWLPKDATIQNVSICLR